MAELTFPTVGESAEPGALEPGGRSVATELSTMVVRALRLSLRNVDGLITALFLPVMLMVMFVYFFGGAIHTGGRYIDYVVPGVLLVCAGFGAGTTAVAVAIGFRPDAGIGHWLAAIGLLALFILALSWLAAAIGVVMRSPEGAQGVTFLISFLPYPSSAFVPTHTMPSWIQGSRATSR